MNPDLCVQRPIVDLSVKIKYLKLLYIDVPYVFHCTEYKNTLKPLNDTTQTRDIYYTEI